MKVPSWKPYRCHGHDDWYSAADGEYHVSFCGQVPTQEINSKLFCDRHAMKST